MGNMALTTPRVILSSELQLHFKRATVVQEVAEIVSGWFEDGAPLGLTLDMFGSIMALQEQGRPFFNTFDTDMNQKVDAFEVLSAFAILAKGTIDEKIEVIFAIFDFADSAHLNFDEINILVHSVYRGLGKVCNTQVVDDNVVMEVCRRLFDSHNLPYDKKVTKEQVRRWLRIDVEAAGFFDIFQNALALPDTEVALAEIEEIQENVFSDLCSSLSSSAVSAQDLLQSQAFREALGSHSDEACLKLTKAMSRGAPIGARTFCKAVRAWNVFSLVDTSTEGELDAKELPNLASLQFPPTQGPKKDPEELRGQLKLNSQGRITRISWIEATLCC